MTVYFALGAVAAFLLGVWLGLPGKYGTRWRRSDQRPGRRGTPRTGVHDPRHLAELEGAMARSGAESKSAKRHFTLFSGLLSRNQRASVRRRGGRSPFQTALGAAEAASGPDAARRQPGAEDMSGAGAADAACGAEAAPLDGARGEGGAASPSAPKPVHGDQEPADERA